MRSRQTCACWSRHPRSSSRAPRWPRWRPVPRKRIEWRQRLPTRLHARARAPLVGVAQQSRERFHDTRAPQRGVVRYRQAGELRGEQEHVHHSGRRRPFAQQRRHEVGLEGADCSSADANSADPVASRCQGHGGARIARAATAGNEDSRSAVTILPGAPLAISSACVALAAAAAIPASRWSDVAATVGVRARLRSTPHAADTVDALTAREPPAEAGIIASQAAMASAWTSLAQLSRRGTRPGGGGPVLSLPARTSPRRAASTPLGDSAATTDEEPPLAPAPPAATHAASAAVAPESCMAKSSEPPPRALAPAARACASMAGPSAAPKQQLPPSASATGAYHTGLALGSGALARTSASSASSVSSTVNADSPACARSSEASAESLPGWAERPRDATAPSSSSSAAAAAHAARWRAPRPALPLPALSTIQRPRRQPSARRGPRSTAEACSPQANLAESGQQRKQPGERERGARAHAWRCIPSAPPWSASA